MLDITKSKLDIKYDLVICSEVLEHIPDDVTALRHLAAMTGKHLILSAPQGRMRRFETREVGHVRNYARGELAGKLAAAGLVPAQVIEWGFPFYSPLYRDYLDFTGARGVSGKFGLFRKLIARAVYGLFWLNSSRKGDEIIIVARLRAAPAASPGGKTG